MLNFFYETADIQFMKWIIRSPYKIILRINSKGQTSIEYILLVAVVGTIFFKFNKDVLRRFRGPAYSCGESYSCKQINPKYERVGDFPIESKIETVPKLDK